MPVDNRTFITRIGLFYAAYYGIIKSCKGIMLYKCSYTFCQMRFLMLLTIVFLIFLICLFKSQCVPIVVLLLQFEYCLYRTVRKYYYYWKFNLYTDIKYFMSTIAYQQTRHHNIIFQCFLQWIIICILLSGDIESNPGQNDHDISSSTIMTDTTIHSDLISNKNLFSMIHMNVQSFLPKKLQIQCEFSSYDIIALTESWLNSNISNDEVMFENFKKPYRADRITETNGGGIIVYVKDTYYSERRHDLELTDIESLWIEVKTKNTRILIGTYYRPSNSGTEFWDKFETALDSAFDLNADIILLTGDFNEDQLKPTNKKIRNICRMYSLYQLITEPTHFWDNSSSLLDVILVSDRNLVDNYTVGDYFLENLYRYHCTVSTRLKIPKQNSPSFSRHIWNYDRADLTTFKETLAHYNWQQDLTVNIDQTTDNITNTILKTATNTIPNKTITIRQNEPPWLNKTIKQMIRKRKRLHSRAKSTNKSQHWAAFRHFRNRCKNYIRTAKQRFHDNIATKLESAKVQTKDWWATIKSLTGYSQKHHNIPPLQHNGQVYDDINDKVQIFNEYFCSQSSINDEHTSIPSTQSQYIDITLTSIYISENDVYDILINLDTSKATGPDGISPFFLKNAATELKYPLSNLFNTSIETGKFPS